ncbi:MAG: extracellular solute-binding protein [Clostridia bacterium]|nr:extracellular solute-binding protein [Clostridia bacterium]
MKKKLLAIVLTSILGVGSVLTGCGPKEEGTDKKDENKVLKLTYSGTPQPHEKEYIINNFIKKFEEKHNAKVEVDFIAQADAIKKIGTEQETGNIVSDVLFIDTANMAPVGTAYAASPNDYIVGAAPKGTKGAGSTAGAWTYGIQKGAKNKELAEEFIKYALDPEVNYELCVEMGGLLSPIKEVGDMLESSDVIMNAGNKMFETTIVSGVPSTDYTDWNAVKLLYGDLFEKIAETKELPDDAFFNDLQSQLDSLRKLVRK